MQQLYIDDQDVQKIIKETLLYTSPEHKAKIESIFSREAEEGDGVFAKFQYYPVKNDQSSLFGCWGFRFIVFEGRTLDLFWLGSFIAWEAFSMYSESDGVPTDTARFKLLIDGFQQLLENSDTKCVSLPVGVPPLDTFLSEDNRPEEAATIKLAHFSLAWSIFHEIYHIKLAHNCASAQVGIDTPERFQEDEFKCDAYATHMIVGGVELYAKHSNEDLMQVRRLRQMGIYLALYTMALIERFGEKLGEGKHPGMQERINRVCKKMGERDPTASNFGQCILESLKIIGGTRYTLPSIE